MSLYAPHVRALVIRPTLRALDMWSKVAEDLLMGTAAVEGGFFGALAQMGGGPALGIFQIEPVTALDILHRYLPERPRMERRFLDAIGFFPGTTRSLRDMSVATIEHKLASDLGFQAAVARLRYWMEPEPLPSENLSGYDYIEALGRYWKAHYNTPAGLGKVSSFVDRYWRTQRR